MDSKTLKRSNKRKTKMRIFRRKRFKRSGKTDDLSWTDMDSPNVSSSDLESVESDLNSCAGLKSEFECIQNIPLLMQARALAIPFSEEETENLLEDGEQHSSEGQTEDCKDPLLLPMSHEATTFMFVDAEQHSSDTQSEDETSGEPTKNPLEDEDHHPSEIQTEDSKDENENHDHKCSEETTTDTLDKKDSFKDGNGNRDHGMQIELKIEVDVRSLMYPL